MRQIVPMTNASGIMRVRTYAEAWHASGGRLPSHLLLDAYCTRRLPGHPDINPAFPLVARELVVLPGFPKGKPLRGPGGLFLPWDDLVRHVAESELDGKTSLYLTPKNIVDGSGLELASAIPHSFIVNKWGRCDPVTALPVKIGKGEIVADADQRYLYANNPPDFYLGLLSRGLFFDGRRLAGLDGRPSVRFGVAVESEDGILVAPPVPAEPARAGAMVQVPASLPVAASSQAVAPSFSFTFPSPLAEVARDCRLEAWSYTGLLSAAFAQGPVIQVVAAAFARAVLENPGSAAELTQALAEFALTHAGDYDKARSGFGDSSDALADALATISLCRSGDSAQMCAASALAHMDELRTADTRLDRRLAKLQRRVMAWGATFCFCSGALISGLAVHFVGKLSSVASIVTLLFGGLALFSHERQTRHAATLAAQREGVPRLRAQEATAALARHRDEVRGYLPAPPA